MVEAEAEVSRVLAINPMQMVDLEPQVVEYVVITVEHKVVMVIHHPYHHHKEMLEEVDLEFMVLLDHQEVVVAAVLVVLVLILQGLQVQGVKVVLEQQYLVGVFLLLMEHLDQLLLDILLVVEEEEEPLLVLMVDLVEAVKVDLDQLVLESQQMLILVEAVVVLVMHQEVLLDLVEVVVLV